MRPASASLIRKSLTSQTGVRRLYFIQPNNADCTNTQRTQLWVLSEDQSAGEAEIGKHPGNGAGGGGNHRLARRGSDEGDQQNIGAPVQHEAGEVGQHEHGPLAMCRPRSMAAESPNPVERPVAGSGDHIGDQPGTIKTKKVAQPVDRSCVDKEANASDGSEAQELDDD